MSPGYESRLITEKEQSQTQMSEMRFCEKSKELRCLTNFVTLQLQNVSTSSCCYSGSKDISLDGLTMLANCFKSGFPNKLIRRSESVEASWTIMNKMACLSQRSWLEPLGTLYK